jgi:hypothetical protein
MLCSSAWRALTAPAKCIIERLIIEHCKHGGKDNGKLICTYQDFVEYGTRRPSIAPAIRLTVKLGFVEITQLGHRSPDHGWPSRYRLTFLATANANPTDEWKNFAAPKQPKKNKSRGTKTYPVLVTKTYPVLGTKT